MNTDKLVLSSILFAILGVLSFIALVRGTFKTSYSIVATIAFFFLAVIFLRHAIRSRRNELLESSKDTENLEQQ